MRSGYGNLFHKEISAVKQDTGISGIFWDSYQNLGVTGLDWGAPDKAPQADEIFRLQAELQKEGFKQRVEVITIFGVSAVGIFGFDNDSFRRRHWRDFVEGDQAFALLDCSPCFFTSERITHPDRLSPEKYFWLAAHRVVPSIGANPWQNENKTRPRLPGGEDAEAYGRVNHLYNALLPFMVRLRLQPGGTHVLWLDGEGRPGVIWAFKDVVVKEFPAAIDVENNETVENNGGLSLQAGRVYGLGTDVHWSELLAAIAVPS